MVSLALSKKNKAWGTYKAVNTTSPKGDKFVNSPSSMFKGMYWKFCTYFSGKVESYFPTVEYLYMAKSYLLQC